jgi:hypothetical protein
LKQKRDLRHPAITARFSMKLGSGVVSCFARVLC